MCLLISRFLINGLLYTGLGRYSVYVVSPEPMFTYTNHAPPTNLNCLYNG